MGKLHSGLVSEAKKKEEEAFRQLKLHEKYHVSDNVKIVEKTNMTKFIINLMVRFVKGTAAILLCALAVIGLLCVLHPDIRPVVVEGFKELLIYIN